MNGKPKTLVNVLIFVIAILFFSSFLGQSINVNFEEDELILSAPEDASLTIAYNQINTTELIDSFDPGTVLSGGENRKCRWGVWENDTWGEYSLFAIKKADHVIRLTTTDGKTVVFNFESTETTKNMYSMFRDLLSDYKNEPLYS